jgi:hypothetical protein
VEEYQIRKYSPADYSAWNAFIGVAKNATFLFHRDFMEYHADKFDDYSLLILKNNSIVAAIPAHIVDDELHSHKGLTYGGFIVGGSAKLVETILMFQELLKHLNQKNFKIIHIKTVPSIYNKKSSDELLYIMFLVDAILTRRDTLSVIDLRRPFEPTKNRIQGIERGRKLNLTVNEEPKFSEFWNQILLPNLQRKHNTLPVHSVDEIINLNKYFPENIRQFNVYHGAELVAGTTVFVTDHVAHSQYIAANENKNLLGSLDFLHYHLITNVFFDKSYFDFGISNESNGKKLNGGIAFWKESFGARTVVQDFYTIETAAYVKLENVLL